MFIQILKSKIHRATVTQAELNYIGSITIDEVLLEATNIVSGERVQIVNINNGERFETYVLTGARDSGIICLNGAAARKVAVGDIIIVISYVFVRMNSAKDFKSIAVFPDAHNKIQIERS